VREGSATDNEFYPYKHLKPNYKKAPIKAGGPVWSGLLRSSFSERAAWSRSKAKTDGHPFRSSFMALGDGTHKLPERADIRQAIAKEVGDTMVVLSEERIDNHS
jgi:hypothetical protein